MSDYLQAAFNQVCKEAKAPQGYYVSLMVRTCTMMPWEGGTPVHDDILVAYQCYETEEAAEAAKEAVEKLAKELSEEEKRAHGRHCLETMEWLDNRGLDADYLPDPDGPDEYFVTVTDELPKSRYGPRHYE